MLLPIARSKCRFSVRVSGQEFGVRISVRFFGLVNDAAVSQGSEISGPELRTVTGGNGIIGPFLKWPGV